ncbi:MAG: PAS domain S-box protein [Myxococcales bacterium]|nr:PAS domain S-box protein [Myxococcales bacterium]
MARALAGAPGEPCRGVMPHPADTGDELRALLAGAELPSHFARERLARASAGVLRQLVEHAPAAVALFDRQMRYIAHSRRYREDYGLGEQEVVGRCHYDVFPEIPERWREVHQRCLAGASDRCDEDPFERADGRVDWVRWEILPWTTEDGGVGGIILFSEVITARKAAEGALRESEERFRSTFEQAAVGIAHVAPDGTWLRVNQKLCSIVGYSREELAAKTFQDITHPDDLDLDLAFVGRVLSGELATYSMQKRYFRKTGETVWIHLTVSLVRKSDGEPDYFISVVEDISERVRASAEFEQQRQLLEEAQALSHIGSVEADLTSGRVHWSAEARRIFGIGEGEPEPDIEAGLSRVYPADLERVRARVEHARAGRGIPEIDFRVLRPGGEVRSVLGRGALRVGDDGHLSVVCSLQDVTDQQRALEERGRLEAQLLAAQKLEAVGRLAGGIAHDFNNIVSAVLGYSDLALAGLRAEDPLRRDLEQVHKAGERAAALTRQLLAFSRRQVLDLRVLDPNQIAADLERMLGRLIGEDVTLRLELDPKVGYVRADRGQLEQVLMNLVVNARDAMPSGGELVIATAAVEAGAALLATYPELASGSWVRLSVRDSGEGMPPEVLARIFEPFFTTKEQGKGTGLGLSTVYGIVRQSGGHVRVESQPGQGSRFDVYLPRLGEAERAASVHPPAPGPAAGSETILLVEDEAAVRDLAARMLRRSGYRVLTAAHGGEALLICEKHPGPIHLLLSDVVMPEMGGRELAERVAQLRPGVRVLFMSGYSDDDVARRGVGGQFAAVVAKPFDVATLTRAVRALLDDARGQRPEG